MTVRARAVPVALVMALGLGAQAAPAAAQSAEAAGREQDTIQLTHGNGPSRNPVISQDRRYAQVIAFESLASNLGPRDVNGVQDVYFLRRSGGDNVGSPWRLRSVGLASRGRGGRPANGPSWGPAVDGGFKRRGGKPTHPRCLAFLSDATNLVRGDTNGQTDAFISHGPGGRVERVSFGGRKKQLPGDTTDVAVSTDCSHVAFVNDGDLYVRSEGRSKRVWSNDAANPSFSSAFSDELVFEASGRIYLMAQKVSRGERRGPLGKPRHVANGTDPAFNDVKCRVVAYERFHGGATQVLWRYLGRGESAGTGASCAELPGGNSTIERVASQRAGRLGNGDSRDPSVHNAGFYIGFESDASNLQTKAGDPDKAGVALDRNGETDAYLFTGTRRITLVMSQRGEPKGVPFAGGGSSTHLSWYANYVVFDSPGDHFGGPLGATEQIFMRYLGPV